MKKIIAKIISFSCYWLGDFISKIFETWDRFVFLYPVYNQLMSLSYDIEQWAGIEFMWICHE